MLLWRLAAVLVVAATYSTAHADIEGDVFRSAEWGIRVRAPANWQMTEQTSYPNIILHLLRPNPVGRMLLSAERVKPGLTSLEYATRARVVLTKLGFRVRPPQLHAETGAYWIDFDNGKAYLRQALLVSDRNAFALTLSAVDSRVRSQHLRAFDYTLRWLRIERAKPGTPREQESGDEAEPAEPKHEACDERERGAGE